MGSFFEILLNKLNTLIDDEKFSDDLYVFEQDGLAQKFKKALIAIQNYLVEILAKEEVSIENHGQEACAAKLAEIFRTPLDQVFKIEGMGVVYRTKFRKVKFEFCGIDGQEANDEDKADIEADHGSIIWSKVLKPIKEKKKNIRKSVAKNVAIGVGGAILVLLGVALGVYLTLQTFGIAPLVFGGIWFGVAAGGAGVSAAAGGTTMAMAKPSWRKKVGRAFSSMGSKFKRKKQNAVAHPQRRQAVSPSPKRRRTNIVSTGDLEAGTRRGRITQAENKGDVSSTSGSTSSTSKSTTTNSAPITIPPSNSSLIVANSSGRYQDPNPQRNDDVLADGDGDGIVYGSPH